MDKVQINDTVFTSRGMVPESGDHLTDLWGRKIVSNLWNSFGIIGTVTVIGRVPTNLSIHLSEKYQYPPEIFLMVKDINSTSLGWTTIRDGNSDRKRIQYCFNGNGIRFMNGSDFENTTHLVVYRIHGV